MTWSLAFPNLLVGLREGLEAGLIVTILIGAVRRLAPGRSLASVWLGVVAAAVLSLSFGAVLTFTRAELSPHAQELFGGTTSLIAVALVTSMIFWMRRTARALSGELREQVGRALTAGGLALAVTAFVAVAREGLETALFVWTNAQAAGSSGSPLAGALLGLVLASGLCVGLYRRVLRVNLARFFTVTGAVLIVIVAGVLAYGITDLQEAGVLPGLDRLAFDLSAQLPTGTWWSETVRGITNLDNRMSWLSVLGYLSYLLITLVAFFRPSRPAAQAAPDQPAPKAAVAAAAELAGSAPANPSGRPDRRRLAVAALLIVPVLVAASWIWLDGRGTQPMASDHRVTVTDQSCAADWTEPTAGSRTYSVANQSSHAVDIELVVSSGQAIVAEIEVLGPGTDRELPITLGPGSYNWKCVYAGASSRESASRTVHPATDQPGLVTNTLRPVTAAELAPVAARYRTYVTGRLDLLDRQVNALAADLNRGDRAAAQQDWLAGHLTYHQLGAAYNAFGEAGAAVDGLASGLPLGVRDPGFTGFHRIESALWSGSVTSGIVGPARALVSSVRALRAQLPKFSFDPNDITLRAHEIVEDTVRFVLTGQDDYGSGSGYRTAQADLAGDRAVVDLLAPLLQQRSANLVPAIHRDQAVANAALARGVATGAAVRHADRVTRQAVNAAISQLAETLAPIPDLLELRNP
ncbi:MAG: iron uptake transporter permease EfeU [Jatrophihabitantaceae bacterium]